MFPVPQHLPRTGGEHISSSLSTGGGDSVLDLLQPLLGEPSSTHSGPSGSGTSFYASQVRDVREGLEKAVTDNKTRSHELLISNFPSVSSHIQLGTTLRTEFTEVQSRLSSLEKEIDPSDPSTSFLPSLISLLNRHFTASSNRTSAHNHVRSLKALARYAEKLRKLEEAVWSGRGADEWVLNEVKGESGFEVDDGREALEGTKIMAAIQTKEGLLKSMIVEQLTEGFNKAISISTPTDGQHGATLSVQPQITLQKPRISRPTYLSSPTIASPYPVSDIYAALSHLSLLEGQLNSLRTRILKDIINPLVTSKWKAEYTTADGLSLVRLEPISAQTPFETLGGVSAFLNYVSTTVFPSSSATIPERDSFLADICTGTFQATLDVLLLPSMPTQLSARQPYLQVLEKAVEVEKSFSPPTRLLEPFFDSEAGPIWAQQRRFALADDTRKVVLSGWGGWEAEEKERTSEVVVLVEVEVEAQAGDVQMEGDDGFGWGFEEEEKAKRASEVEDQPSTGGDADVTMREDDGWGFEGSATAGPSKSASPVKVKKQPDQNAEPEEDGWDLDPVVPAAEPAKPPSPVKPIKPAREAKRLGKKVAKARHTDDDDPWGSASDSNFESPGSSVLGTENGHGETPAVIPNTSSEETGPTIEEGWGWDEEQKAEPVLAPTEPEPPAPAKKTKRTELREEIRTVKEISLVSKACQSILDLAKIVLSEIQELHTSSYTSPSFSTTSITPILQQALSEIFTLYRAILPTHFSKQLEDVPSLAMQAYNDTLHLASEIATYSTDMEDDCQRLKALGENIFETQLEYQRRGIMEVLDELSRLEGTGDEKTFRQCERGIQGLVHNLESLSRVIKPVLPRSKQLEVLGYLVTALIARISDDILSLDDITEVESNRLTELLRLVYPLENLFGDDGRGGIVGHVRGWLKFCYISEVLQANLVDITYLLDQGALVDFTVPELTSLVRALFASSEKRDGVIERIEREGTGAIAPVSEVSGV
ncbi:hypothetical protein CI109_107378 [Kwoniella shandongensis]|uniref:ZW10 C-terminal helical domain-containing protein n=1 Tax=Kwoniella shandongensis TaxID=1734106 RepID=A0A5M6BVM7_9TREE|nr:uncharacterized protein CI109_004694 [Kwoniella shandongensis]KAA5526918.1 hypothetical protein CI109_004694 [Kwoniella shandongensis]